MARRKLRHRRGGSSLLRFAWLLTIGSVLVGAVYMFFNEADIINELRSKRPNMSITLLKSDTPNLRQALENFDQGLGGQALVELSPLQEQDNTDEGTVNIYDSSEETSSDDSSRFFEVEYWRGVIRDVREGLFETVGDIVDSFVIVTEDFSIRGFLDLFFASDPLDVDDSGSIVPLREREDEFVSDVGAGGSSVPSGDTGDNTAETLLSGRDRLASLGDVPDIIYDEVVSSRSLEDLVESLRPEDHGVDAYAGLLHPNPDPSLIELTPEGVLPKIDGAGRYPWQVYRRPHISGSNLPQVSVIMMNLGLDDTATAESVILPGEITLAFSSYARRLQDWIEVARDEGHEVLLTLPMEPQRYPKSDPGPFGLLTSLSEEDNIRNLNYNLSRATGYIGVINFLGDKFVLDAGAVEPIMQRLNLRGLIFVDTNPERLSLASLSATVLNMPHATVDIIIDQRLSRSQVGKRMRDASRLARARSRSIVLVYPYPNILEELKSWLSRLSESGIELVPLSSLVLEVAE